MSGAPVSKRCDRVRRSWISPSATATRRVLRVRRSHPASTWWRVQGPGRSDDPVARSGVSPELRRSSRSIVMPRRRAPAAGAGRHAPRPRSGDGVDIEAFDRRGGAAVDALAGIVVEVVATGRWTHNSVRPAHSASNTAARLRPGCRNDRHQRKSPSTCWRNGSALPWRVPAYRRLPARHLRHARAAIASVSSATVPRGAPRPERYPRQGPGADVMRADSARRGCFPRAGQPIGPGSDPNTRSRHAGQ